MTPPDPTHVRAEYVLDSGATLTFFANGAILLREDETHDSVWLNNIGKQQLHQALEDHNPWGPGKLYDS